MIKAFVFHSSFWPLSEHIIYSVAITSFVNDSLEIGSLVWDKVWKIEKTDVSLYKGDYKETGASCQTIPAYISLRFI